MNIKEIYKQVWREKPSHLVQHELHVINNWPEDIEKFLHREALSLSDKTKILQEILEERGE